MAIERNENTGHNARCSCMGCTGEVDMQALADERAYAMEQAQTTSVDSRLAAAKARLAAKRRDAGMDMYGIDEPRQAYRPVKGDHVDYTGPDGYRRSGVVVQLDDGSIARMVRIEDENLGHNAWIGLATVRPSR